MTSALGTKPLTTVDHIRHLFRHQLTLTRRVWWTVIVAGIMNPTLFLLGIGVGIGTQIADTELVRLGASSYLEWIGPGVLAVSAMEIGAREAMWPTEGLIKRAGSYKAIMRTPIPASTMAVAHTTWIGFRSLVSAVCFLGVLAVARVPESWWALAIPLIAMLVAVVHGGPLVALNAWLTAESVFPAIQRVILFPLFLFSGAFFPIEDMPAAFTAVARILPSRHAVEACRDLATGSVGAGTVGHLGLLAALAIPAVLLARRSFARNLKP